MWIKFSCFWSQAHRSHKNKSVKHRRLLQQEAQSQVQHTGSSWLWIFNTKMWSSHTTTIEWFHIILPSIFREVGCTETLNFISSTLKLIVSAGDINIYVPSKYAKKHEGEKWCRWLVAVYTQIRTQAHTNKRQATSSIARKQSRTKSCTHTHAADVLHSSGLTTYSTEGEQTGEGKTKVKEMLSETDEQFVALSFCQSFPSILSINNIWASCGSKRYLQKDLFILSCKKKKWSIFMVNNYFYEYILHFAQISPIKSLKWKTTF